VVKHIKQYQTF